MAPKKDKKKEPKKKSAQQIEDERILEIWKTASDKNSLKQPPPRVSTIEEATGLKRLTFRSAMGPRQRAKDKAKALTKSGQLESAQVGLYRI